jgi:hypothetical protein
MRGFNHLTVKEGESRREIGPGCGLEMVADANDPTTWDWTEREI